MPTAPGADGPMQCIWETREDMSVEDFQTFIDGENGPDGGAGLLINKVYKAMPGGNTPNAIFVKAA